MATRFEHDGLRVATPRLKDVPELRTDREPARGRAPDGRFQSGNREATARGAKEVIRRGLGRIVGDDELDARVKQALVIYRDELRSMPADSPAVRAECASAARQTILAAALLDAAHAVGLTTDQGLKLADQARKHDQAATRHRTAAYDRAVRLANAGGTTAPTWNDLMEATK